MRDATDSRFLVGARAKVMPQLQSFDKSSSRARPASPPYWKNRRGSSQDPPCHTDFARLLWRSILACPVASQMPSQSVMTQIKADIF
jgi:hypothetical protein